MSLLPFRIPTESNAPNILVWNNAAYDDDGDGTLEEKIRSTSTSSSWWTHCHDSHSSKENLDPAPENSSFASLLQSELKPAKNDEDDDERRIDMEIEEIEKEIARLSSRLSTLKQEKAESKMKKRGRTVLPNFSGANRRGVSLGPSDIQSASKLRFLNKAEGGILTPAAASSKMTRKVSCFWRLQEIDELNVIKERGKSASLSPKSRKPWPKAQPLRQQAATTGGSKKPAKKNGVVPLIQPRILFKEVEKAVPPSAIKKAKAGRIVPSRYNTGELRKRSLPHDVKEEATKRRFSKPGNGNPRSINESGKVKKRCDPVMSVEVCSTPAAEVLPKIRRLRWESETPRDSGAAKRVAELVGRKTFFDDDEDAEDSGDDDGEMVHDG